MARKFKLTVTRNGSTFTTDNDGDKMHVIEGHNLKDTLEAYDFGTAGFTHLKVNGELLTASEAEEFVVDSDLAIEFVNKSEGGNC